MESLPEQCHFELEHHWADTHITEADQNTHTHTIKIMYINVERDRGEKSNKLHIQRPNWKKLGSSQWYHMSPQSLFSSISK